MAEQPDEARARSLDERITAAKARRAPKPPVDDHYARANLAWRMVIELVAGLVIGVGIGYGLDVLLGTLPWLLVFFTLAGFAAGVKTMMRTAQEIAVEGDEAGDGD